MSSSRETLLGEAKRCRDAAKKAVSQEVRDGLLDLAQRYEELAAKAAPDSALPPLERDQPQQSAQQQQQPQDERDKD